MVGLVKADGDWARMRFAQARVARLATVSAEGVPHLVPITFAVLGDTIVSAVDHKPKSTTRLRRLSNIAANPSVSVLVDDYHDDWTRLWWARADGLARAVLDGPQFGTAVAALVRRYAQYRDLAPAGPVIVIDVSRWSGWAAQFGGGDTPRTP